MVTLSAAPAAAQAAAATDPAAVTYYVTPKDMDMIAAGSAAGFWSQQIQKWEDVQQPHEGPS